MKARLAIALVVLSLLLAACPSSGTRPDADRNAPSADFLIGEWEDSEGTLFTFEKADGVVRLARILDTDGEIFEVREFGWREGSYTLTYYVPSTGYVVTVRLHDTSGDALDGDWTNSANDTGPERFTRPSFHDDHDGGDDEDGEDGEDGDNNGP